MAYNIENYDPKAMYQATWTTGKNMSVGGTFAVAGASTFTGIATFTDAPAFSKAGTGASVLRIVTNSAAAGATVVLTAAQCGQTFNNASTSANPSWTLPAAANGLWYTFTVSNAATGFTITGGTMKYKTTATGTTLSTTTLTNTQGTAVVNDHITFVCDGTVWRCVAQSGIFA